jgi:hypothetical protein
LLPEQILTHIKEPNLHLSIGNKIQSSRGRNSAFEFLVCAHSPQFELKDFPWMDPDLTSTGVTMPSVQRILVTDEKTRQDHGLSKRNTSRALSVVRKLALGEIEADEAKVVDTSRVQSENRATWRRYAMPGNPEDDLQKMAVMAQQLLLTVFPDSAPEIDRSVAAAVNRATVLFKIATRQYEIAKRAIVVFETLGMDREKARRKLVSDDRGAKEDMRRQWTITELLIRDYSTARDAGIQCITSAWEEWIVRTQVESKQPDGPKRPLDRCMAALYKEKGDEAADNDNDDDDDLYHYFMQVLDDKSRPIIMKKLVAFVAPLEALGWLRMFGDPQTHHEAMEGTCTSLWVMSRETATKKMIQSYPNYRNWFRMPTARDGYYRMGARYQEAISDMVSRWEDSLQVADVQQTPPGIRQLSRMDLVAPFSSGSDNNVWYCPNLRDSTQSYTDAYRLLWHVHADSVYDWHNIQLKKKESYKKQLERKRESEKVMVAKMKYVQLILSKLRAQHIKVETAIKGAYATPATAGDVAELVPGQMSRFIEGETSQSTGVKIGKGSASSPSSSDDDDSGGGDEGKHNSFAYLVMDSINAVARRLEREYRGWYEMTETGIPRILTIKADKKDVDVAASSDLRALIVTMDAISVWADYYIQQAIENKQTRALLTGLYRSWRDIQTELKFDDHDERTQQDINDEHGKWFTKLAAVVNVLMKKELEFRERADRLFIMMTWATASTLKSGADGDDDDSGIRRMKRRNITIEDDDEDGEDDIMTSVPSPSSSSSSSSSSLSLSSSLSSLSLQ